MAKRMITPFKAYESRSPNGNEKGYVRITRSLFESDAVKGLTDLALRFYLDMIMVAKGHEKVLYSQNIAMKHLGISKGGYTSAIKQLINVGLIEKMPRGCFAPATYKFSSKWHKYVNPKRDIMTNEIISQTNC